MDSNISCTCHGGPNCCMVKASDSTNQHWQAIPGNIFTACITHGIYNCQVCAGYVVTPQQWPPLTQLDLDEDDLDETPHKCPVCDGAGEVDDSLYKDGSTDCRTCEGGGIVWG